MTQKLTELSRLALYQETKKRVRAAVSRFQFRPSSFALLSELCENLSALSG
jgi:hypothetical protein